jgi:hypothetical protein
MNCAIKKAPFGGSPDPKRCRNIDKANFKNSKMVGQTMSKLGIPTCSREFFDVFFCSRWKNRFDMTFLC